MKDKDILDEAKKNYDTAVDGWNDIYTLSREDIKFAYDIEDGQWPSNVRSARANRPIITVNKLQKFIRQQRGDFGMNRPSMKVIPADDNADVRMAELYNGIIRQIEYISNAPIAYDTAYAHTVAGSIGYWRIVTDYSNNSTFNQDIFIKRILNPHSVHFDPYGVEFNFEDAKYCFIEELIDTSEFNADYPGAEAVNFSGERDNLTDSLLGSGAKEKIRVCEYFVKEPQKKQIIQFSSGDVFEVNDKKTLDYYKSMGLIPVRDRIIKTHIVKWYKLSGKEILDKTTWVGDGIPIIPMLGDEVIVDGKRYYLSLIRGAKGPQQMYNYWASAATENLMLTPKTPFIVDHRQIEGFEKEWDDSNLVPRTYLRYKAVAGLQKPYREPQTQIPTGIDRMMEKSAYDIEDHLGRYEASKGEQGNERSGKAIIARINQSDKGTFTFVDNATRSIVAGLKQIVNIIPKIYDTPRALQILGEGEERQSVSVNQPVSDGQGGIVTQNDLTVGQYDVIASIGASFGSKREEMVKMLIESMQYAPTLAPIIAPLVFKYSDWPGAKEVAVQLEQAAKQQQEVVK